MFVGKIFVYAKKQGSNSLKSCKFKMFGKNIVWITVIKEKIRLKSVVIMSNKTDTITTQNDYKTR